MVPRPAAIGSPARSMPVKRLPGSMYAMGIRLLPSPQAISSRRQLVTGAGVIPIRVRTAASRSGWVLSRGKVE